MTIDYDAQLEAFKRGEDVEPEPEAAGTPESQTPEPVDETPAPPEPSQAPSWWDTPVEPLGDPELDLPPSLVGKPAREIVRMMKGYAHQAHQAGFQKNEVEAENRALKALLERVSAQPLQATTPAPQRDPYRERGLDPDIDIASRTRDVLDATADAAAEKIATSIKGELEAVRKQQDEVRKQQEDLQRQYDTNLAIHAMEQARLNAKDIDGNTPDPETWKSLARKHGFHIQTNQWDPREVGAWSQAYEIEKDEVRRVWRVAPTVHADPAATPGAPPLGTTRAASQGNVVAQSKTLDQRSQKYYDELVARFGIKDKEGLLHDLLDDE